MHADPTFEPDRGSDAHLSSPARVPVWLALVGVLAMVAALVTGGSTALADPDAGAPGDPDEDGEARFHAEGHEVTPARFDGEDRHETAALIAEHTYGPDATDTALVARGDDFPDALAGAAAAGVDEGPVLLVRGAEIPDRTTEALDSLEVDHVHVLGGEAAVSDDVVETLEERYGSASRLAGEDRYETAAEVARHTGAGILFGQRGAIVVSGEGFADAVAAAPLAYSGPVPILLTRQAALPGETREALADLEIEQVVVAGGPAAVSSDVVAEMGEMGIDVERIHGVDRTETARALADRFVDTWGYEVSTTMLATGADFADALAAGPRGGELRIPVLLTEAHDVAGVHTSVWLADRCPDVGTVQAVGGTAAVSTAALDEATDAAGACHPDRRLTYEIGTRGEVHGDVGVFRQRVHEALSYVAGWPLDGDLEFVEVASDADMRIWLASPQAVDDAHQVCSPQWSCRVGDDIYMNDERWRHATDTYEAEGRSLTEYRHYVVNHEVGHWLGHGHPDDCGEASGPAAVMYQQSIRTSECHTNVWPLEWERDAVRSWWLD